VRALGLGLERGVRCILTALVHGLEVLKYWCMELEYRFKMEFRRTAGGWIGDMEWVSWTRAIRRQLHKAWSQ
jgi:hypothetical protein